MVWKAQYGLVFSYFETYSYISALSLDPLCTGPFPTVWAVSVLLNLLDKGRFKISVTFSEKYLLSSH